MPAFTESLDLARKELEQLVSDTRPPSFENTIEEIDSIGRVLGRVSSVFFNLEHAETTDRLQEIAQEVSPLLSEFNNDIYLSEKQASQLHEGDTLTGHTVAGEKTAIGTVRLITQAPGFADLKMSREKGQSDLSAFQVRIYTEPADGIQPGMTIEVREHEFTKR